MGTNKLKAFDVGFYESNNEIKIYDDILNNDNIVTIPCFSAHHKDPYSTTEKFLLQKPSEVLQNPNYTNYQYDSDEFSYWSENDEDDISSDSDKCGDSENTAEQLWPQLANWALDDNIALKSVKSLLQILHPHLPFLPCDARTLLHTPKSVPLKDLPNGKYYHFGIENCIKNVTQCGLALSNLSHIDKISMQCNIDGLPLFKSTGLQLWPILGLLKTPRSKKPFLIGIFSDYSKPSDLNEFLREFVDEGCRLEQSGINMAGKTYKFSFHSFVCDAPARVMLKNIKSFNGYYGCERCIQSGKYLGRMTFPEVSSNLRTNENFRNLLFEEHHLNNILSPLAQLSIDMVTDFVLDYMHLVCLGVMRKLLILWLKGPLLTRLSSKIVLDISEKMIRLRQYIPCEFARKPRSLSEVDRWKATEFRMFLLYIGPIVLEGNLSDDIYKHFLLFHVAISCLISNRFHHQLNSYAKSLLLLFVQNAEFLYGAEFVIYNVHCLVHVADDAKKFGPLDNISSFPFENHLRSIKRLIRRPSLPLQQIVKRIKEKNAQTHHNEVFEKSATFICEGLHDMGPTINTLQNAMQYSSVICTDGSWKLSIASPNNCVLVKNLQVGLVQNILRQNEETFIIVKLYHDRTSFYKYPVESEKLNVYCVRNLQDKLCVFSIEDIISKCLCISHEEKIIVMPFL